MARRNFEWTPITNGGEANAYINIARPENKENIKFIGTYYIEKEESRRLILSFVLLSCRILYYIAG